MKHTSYKSIFALAALLLSATLLLSACGSGSETPAQGSASTNSASDTTAATSAPAASADCPVGSWNLSDFSAYMNSIEQNMSNSSNASVTVTSGDFTGSAVFTFNADKTTTLKTDNFVQKLTISTEVSGRKLDIPITLSINGTSSGKYSLDGDKMTFSDQDKGDMVITVETSGNSSTVDQSLLGEPGTLKLYQYACPSADTLTLKVVAVKSMDLAPLTLTRIK